MKARMVMHDSKETEERQGTSMLVAIPWSAESHVLE